MLDLYPKVYGIEIMKAMRAKTKSERVAILKYTLQNVPDKPGLAGKISCSFFLISIFYTNINLIMHLANILSPFSCTYDKHL